MSKITTIKLKVKLPEGNEDYITVFVDQDGYVSGAVNSHLLREVGSKNNATKVNSTSPFVVTDEVKSNMRFFSDLSPCYFEGCEELKKLYKKELTELESKGNCPACEKGALIRKYLNLISLSRTTST